MAAVPIHGTLRIARSEGSATGLRFLGHVEPDGPGAILAVDDLPDAELTLRAFPDAASRSGYAAALGEHGGNAVAWEESPDGAGPPLLLVARFDRPSRPATTLEEAIPLLGGDARFVASYAARRQAEIERIDRRREADAVDAHWSGELASVRRLGGMLLASELGHLEFFMPGSDLLGSVRLTRAEGRLHLGWKPLRAAFEGDLGQAWDQGVRDLGLVDDSDAGIGIVVDSLDGDALAKVKDAKSGLESLLHRLADKSNRRRRIAEAARNPATSKVLERAAGGLVVMASEKLAPCAQMSSRSRKAQTVSLSLVTSLVNDGLLAHLWGTWDDGFGARGRRAPNLYGITETGRAFVEGRHRDAEDGVRLRPGDPVQPSTTDLSEALDSVMRGTHDLLSPLEPENRVANVPRADDYDSWGWILSEALAGRLSISPDGRSMDEIAPLAKSP